MEHINEITAEDIKLAERMHDARQKGLYFETRAVTNLYNKLYHTNLSATSCGSCIRKRIDGIWKKVQEIKAITEPIKQEENAKEKESTESGTPNSAVTDGGKVRARKTKKADA